VKTAVLEKTLIAEVIYCLRLCGDFLAVQLYGTSQTKFGNKLF